VIMATLNSGRVLEGCLKSIRKQDYDQERIEIVVADGGSKDGTVGLVKKYGGKVVGENTGSPEAAKAVALKKTKNELVLGVDEDNVLPNKGWLALMVRCFLKEPEAIGVYTFRYAYQPEAKSLNRYFSLMGANDPVARFLGRADRQDYLSDRWRLGGRVEDKGEYFVVEYKVGELPTVGANGFLIRRKDLLTAQVDEKHFGHIDVNVDILKKKGGRGKYVVVKNEVVHVSGENVGKFFKKRSRYMRELYMEEYENRRYFLYDPAKDLGKIILYSLVSLTLVWPTLESLWGFWRIPDLAWFWHPVVSFFMFWVYFWAVMKKGLGGVFKFVLGTSR
jgi:glycosyltransferase involved in cell wall biosynthesis